MGYAVENVKHFKAYEALSSSAHKNTEASIFIGVAGGLLLLVSLPVILCGCWKNPHENRCKLFLVSTVYSFCRTCDFLRYDTICYCCMLLFCRENCHHRYKT